MYEGVDPCVRDYFNRTFNSSFNVPKLGLGIGGALFTFASISSFSIPARFTLLCMPVFIDFLRNSRDTKSEIKSAEFLDWVISYRKARSFNERHRHLFNNEEVKYFFKLE